MFCPRCATENGEEQKFCRRCGLSLAGVRFALAGRVEEAEPLVKKARNLLTWAFWIFGCAVVNCILSSNDQWAVFVVAVVGCVLLLTVLILAAARLSAAQKLFGAPKSSDEEATEDSRPAVEGAADTNPQLPPAPPPDPLGGFRAPHSVAEGTTIKLREPEKVRRPRPK